MVKFLDNIDLQNVAKIVNLPVPTVSSDIVTKGFVDTAISNAINGFDFQTDVTAIQGSDGSLDLVGVQAGQRFIITDTSKLPDAMVALTGTIGNGDIVEYNGTDYVIAYDVSERGDGVFTYVKSAKEYYRYIDTTWSIAKVSVTTAGNGLEDVSGTFNVKVDGTTVGLNASQALELKDNSVTAAKIVNGTITADKLAEGVIPQGTLKKFSANIGDGSATSITVTHNLNEKDVILQVYDLASGETVSTTTVRTDLNTATVTFAQAPTSDAYRLVILG